MCEWGRAASDGAAVLAVQLGDAGAEDRSVEALVRPRPVRGRDAATFVGIGYALWSLGAA